MLLQNFQLNILQLAVCDMLTTLNYADVEDSLTAGTMPSDSRSILLADSILETNDDMGG